MKSIGTSCKFCHRPVTIQIDDSYDEHGDIHKLIPMCSCNRCADLRVARRVLWYKLLRVCRNLQMLGQSDTKERETYRKILIILTKNYAQLIARWNGMEGMVWEEEVVNAIMAKPMDWPDIVNRLWRMFKLWQEQQRQAESGLEGDAA